MPAAEPAGARNPTTEPDGTTGFRAALVKMRGEEKKLDRWLGRVMERGLGDPQELLRLQVVVHRFQYQVELASRAVEQVSQGIRTLTRPT